MADKSLSEMTDDELSSEIKGYEFMKAHLHTGAELPVVNQILVVLYGEVSRRSRRASRLR